MKKSKGLSCEYRQAWRAKYPWLCNLYKARSRCNSKNETGYKNYGGKGIKCLLTPEQVKFMWVRDKACLMKKPTIDRIDSNANYELSNCRFLESSENAKRAIKQFCHNGHLKVGENLFLFLNKKTGYYTRSCRICRNKNKAKARECAKAAKKGGRG